MVFYPGYGFCLCFPGSTQVTTPTGGKRLDELKQSERVLTVGRGGRIKWTKFYAFVHKKEDLRTNFLVLKTANGKKLSVTEGHLIFVHDQRIEKPVAKKACDIQEGEQLICMGKDGKVETSVVMERSLIEDVGIFAPLTFSGTFFADGILASCYADVNNHNMAHLAFAPLRTMTSMGVEERLDKEGVNQYALFLIKLREHTPNFLRSYLNVC